MIVIDLKTGLRTELNNDMSLSCAVGNFDGVHKGHLALLQKAAEKNGCTHSAVWTFATHPRVCMGDENFSELTTTGQKLALFADAGIELAILEDFPAVKDMSPEDFAVKLLYGRCGVRTAVCGYNFRFGKNAAGTPALLSKEFSRLGADVITVDAVKTAEGEIISSSAIRALIEGGNIGKANEMLGREFTVSLPVSEGHKLGRTLGLPTINQVFPSGCVIPRHGVYAAKCNIKGKEYIAVANVGVRPTVTENIENINCETHIIDFSGNLYGEVVSVRLCCFLRDEKKFSSVAELKSAITADILKTEELFSSKGQKQ